MVSLKTILGLEELSEDAEVLPFSGPLLPQAENS